MGTKPYPLHPDDAVELKTLRDRLVQLRLGMGLTPPQVSVQAGRNADFVGRLERYTGVRTAPLFSSVQLWASGLNARVELELDDFWLYSHSDPEFLLLFRQSRPFAARHSQRLLLVAMLRRWRMCNRLDLSVVAPLMAPMSTTSLSDWESESQDPLLGRAMFYARVLGTRLRLRVFTRQQWRFD